MEMVKTSSPGTEDSLGFLSRRNRRPASSTVYWKTAVESHGEGLNLRLKGELIEARVQAEKLVETFQEEVAIPLEKMNGQMKQMMVSIQESFERNMRDVFEAHSYARDAKLAHNATAKLEDALSRLNLDSPEDWRLWKLESERQTNYILAQGQEIALLRKAVAALEGGGKQRFYKMLGDTLGEQAVSFEDIHSQLETELKKGYPKPNLIQKLSRHCREHAFVLSEFVGNCQAYAEDA